MAEYIKEEHELDNEGSTMEKAKTPKIPQSVIESLARATLAAMRREKEQERSSGSEASGYDGKTADNKEQTRPESEKVL